MLLQRRLWRDLILSLIKRGTLSWWLSRAAMPLMSGSNALDDAHAAYRTLIRSFVILNRHLALPRALLTRLSPRTRTLAGAQTKRGIRRISDNRASVVALISGGDDVVKHSSRCYASRKRAANTAAYNAQPRWLRRYKHASPYRALCCVCLAGASGHRIGQHVQYDQSPTSSFS